MCSASNHRSGGASQRGLASLEFVLCLPIVLLLTLLAMAVTRLGHLRLDVQVSARNSAHAYAKGLDQLAPIDSGSDWKGAQLQIDHSGPGSDTGVDFLDDMDGRHDRVGVLGDADVTATVDRAESTFVSQRQLGFWEQTVAEEHAVIAATIWEREDLPRGYDQYLRDRLQAATFDIAGLVRGNALRAVPNLIPPEQ